jgi:protein-L-isoaspartate(D-aspartate) O-methyltransferase
VGTGSGYQAAVLAELVDQVYSIEIIEALATSARERLQRLGYDNVTTKLGDGYYGWKAHAPFDSIIVTAAASHVPPPLIEQLKPGGKKAGRKDGYPRRRAIHDATAVAAGKGR